MCVARTLPGQVFAIALAAWEGRQLVRGVIVEGGRIEGLSVSRAEGQIGQTVALRSNNHTTCLALAEFWGKAVVGLCFISAYFYRSLLFSTLIA